MTTNSTKRIPIGLCLYGIAYTTGLVGHGTPRANPQPVGPNEFLDLAVQYGLSSVETHLAYISPQEDEATLLAFRDRARDLGLQFVIAGPKIDVEAFRQHLPLAAKLGVRTVRCVISGILCGDRRPIGGLEGWQRHLAETTQKLKTIAPQAEDLGIRIGVENHQDATSADLIGLCEEVGSPNVGIVLDTGNPLAVAEDPVEFAERILPHLVHVHLKDYRMVRTESGYRLFHCAIGAGQVDFAALFKLFDTKPDVLRHIEMAALGERHIRVLEAEYWANLAPQRAMVDTLPVLRRLQNAEVDVEWRTPWETGDENMLVDWEMQRLDESVANMQRVLAANN